MSDMELYSRYFPAGKKIGVGIPLANAEVFKDWAIIHEIEEDLISLQLSRDVLPVDVALHYGQILELRGGSENSGYCCRAIVVSEDVSRELLLRLIGEIVSDELREFYRIDAFLPIKYFVSHEQHLDVLHDQWEERKQLRLLREIERNDTNWSGKNLPAGAELPKERHAAPSDVTQLEQSDVLDAWDTIIPLAANISGGGLRVITHQEFEDGDYTLLEIMVPTPRRIIDVVGKVVFANRNYAAGSDSEYFNTGIQFVYIEERDRDAIVRYISTIQLKRIRQLRERYLYRGGIDDRESSDTAQSDSLWTLKQKILVLFLIVLLGILVDYFWHYAHGHPKGEIQRIFDEGIMQYRQQMKQTP